jgi:CHAT domain
VIEGRRGRRSAGRGLLVLAVALCGWSAPLDRSCQLARDARQWQRVESVCRGARWAERRQLAQARIALDAARPSVALYRAYPLLTSADAADAEYIIGYIRGNAAQDGDDEARRRAKAHLERAFAGYRRDGRHAEASRAASFMGRLSTDDDPFDYPLRMARLTEEEAKLAGDPLVQGRAAAALAEVYDVVGMERVARARFLQAEDLVEPWPDELAQVYLKHANFLLDLGRPVDLSTSLLILKEAEGAFLRAKATKQAAQLDELPLAIALNRADALSQLERLDEAAAEIDGLVVANGSEEQARLHLVAGYIAARRKDPVRAERLFEEAGERFLQDDYRWRIAVELARAYRAAGRVDRAEQSLRTAIGIVEKLRSSAAKLELRPWVLARRNLAHQELFQLLVAQGRNDEALRVAESLHARTWLDAVIGTTPAVGDDEAHALLAARIRKQLSQASMEYRVGSDLAPSVADRELLVFLEIGKDLWRGHLAGGIVSFTQLPQGTAAAAATFREAPDNAKDRARASELLLPPGLTASREPLYVVAHGALADVPFAALEVGDSFLVARRSIARLPGLAALRCSARSWGADSVVLGDSKRDLPAAAGEAEHTATLLRTSAHVGASATRAVLASARNADLVHLATHNVSTSAGRAIVLADGAMTAAEILEGGIAPRVAVLSGCATAASDAPESWDGFPSAFLAAGSRYVIATFRSIGDVEAAPMMAAYYAQPDGSPIERLAAAQRSVLSTLPVKTWASFAAWGADDCEPPPEQLTFSAGFDASLHR